MAPIHIVMTPTRNEAWVIRLFLESTSRWADYIIFADQMSTDGTRDIIKEYSQSKIGAQIILIDNNNPEFNEAERQSMLVTKAREIADGRDTFLWGLDADEILSANFRETEDWRIILSSQPGSVFWFKWAEICPNQKEYWLSKNTYYPWLFHDDGKEPHGNYVRNMHSMRIPYPLEEKHMYYVDDFRVLHLAYLNPHRVASKRRYYQFVDWEMNHRPPVKLSRTYFQTKKGIPIVPLSKEMLPSEIDIFQLTDTKTVQCYMDQYIIDRFNRHLQKELRRLDIWDDDFIQGYHLNDPRTKLDKKVHAWLRRTAMHSDSLFVKIGDKLIKLFYGA